MGAKGSPAGAGPVWAHRQTGHLASSADIQTPKHAKKWCWP